MKTIIKKTMTAIIASIMLITSMSVTAFAANTELTEAQKAYPGYIPYTGFVPYKTYIPYWGTDFSEQAVYERMIALKEYYPDGTPWNPSKKGGETGCGAFALMLQQAAFGITPYYYIDYRQHFDLNALRVGDYVQIKNGAGGEHVICVLEIKDDSIVIADGNRNGMAKWGTEYTMKQLRGNGAYSFLYALTRYNEDGTIIINNIDPYTPKPTPVWATPAPTETTKPAVKGLVISNTIIDNVRTVIITKDGKMIAQKSDYFDDGILESIYGIIVTDSADKTSVTVTHLGKTVTVNVNETKTIEDTTTPVAPAQTTAPAATTPAKPATTAPATTTASGDGPAATTTNGFVFVNNTGTKPDKKTYSFYANGFQSTDIVHTNNGARYDYNGTAFKMHGIEIKFEKGNNDFIVTYNGQIYRVAPGQSITVNK